MIIILSKDFKFFICNHKKDLYFIKKVDFVYIFINKN